MQLTYHVMKELSNIDNWEEEGIPGTGVHKDRVPQVGAETFIFQEKSWLLRRGDE